MDRRSGLFVVMMSKYTNFRYAVRETKTGTDRERERKRERDKAGRERGGQVTNHFLFYQWLIHNDSTGLSERECNDNAMVRFCPVTFSRLFFVSRHHPLLSLHRFIHAPSLPSDNAPRLAPFPHTSPPPRPRRLLHVRTRRGSIDAVSSYIKRRRERRSYPRGRKRIEGNDRRRSNIYFYLDTAERSSP